MLCPHRPENREDNTSGCRTDGYVYSYVWWNEGDNPTLGIILCSDTDEDIAKYSILHGHEQLFASKYKTCLPSEEQLREEIEIQKRFYYLQKEEDKENKDF